ncbi:MAG: class II aldolase/adducin family protein [Candidatus Didemnitutus sp.]|nr:class II aldolase/adducin family protein [Candidatus Didemnitutus sp.]
MSLSTLLGLSRELGAPERQLAILGEGNTSCRLESGDFLVKASGSTLATLAEADVTTCDAAPLVALLDDTSAGDAEVETVLLRSRRQPQGKKPSVEAVFHAWLLSLPGVNFVGHTHPIAVNGVLCSEHARAFAANRLFPDEIVCCGTASVFVPYTDPGLALARAIRCETLAFREKHGQLPRVILLENHGLIAIGPTAAAVQAATLMAEKAARILIGAASIGAVKYLSPEQVARIAGRADEHHRRKVLGI